MLFKMVNWVFMIVSMTFIMSMSSIKPVSCHILMFVMSWLVEMPTFCVVHSGALVPVCVSFVAMSMRVCIVCLVIRLVSHYALIMVELVF